MRKLIVPAFLLMAFATTAFMVQPGKGVSKIGNSLYKVSYSAAFTPEEKNEIIGTVGKMYKIQDLQNAGETRLQGMEYANARGFKRTVLVETSVSRNRVNERIFIIRGEGALAQDENFGSVSKILSKYGN